MGWIGRARVGRCRLRSRLRGRSRCGGWVAFRGRRRRSKEGLWSRGVSLCFLRCKLGGGQSRRVSKMGRRFVLVMLLGRRTRSCYRSCGVSGLRITSGSFAR